MTARVDEAVVIARSDLRRRFRKLSENRIVGVLLLFPVVFAVLSVVGALPVPGYEAVRAAPGAYVYGAELGTASGRNVLQSTRGFAGVLFVLVTYATVMGEAQAGENVASHHELYLLTSSTATVALGEFLKRLLFTNVVFGPVVVAGALAFGAGLGDPLTTASLLCSGVALLVTAVAFGQLATALGKHALATVDTPGWTSRLVGAGLILVMLAVVYRFRRATAVLRDTPLGWYGDLGLLAAPVDGSVLASAAVLVVAPVAVLANLSVLTRYGPRSWLDTYARGTDTEDGAGTEDGADRSRERVDARDTRVEAALERVVSRPVASTIATSWRRVARTPESFLYVVAMLPVGLGPIASIYADRPALVPAVAAVYASALVALGLTLNPIGNEGRALPLGLTTPGGCRTLVVGYALSVLLPGVVLVPVTVLAASLLVGLPALQSAVLVVLGGALVATTAFASVAIGAALPKYEGTRLATNGGLQTPRFEAIPVVFLVSLLVALPVLVAVQSPASVPAALAVSDRVRLVASSMGSVLFAAGAVRLSVRYAVSTLRSQRVL